MLLTKKGIIEDGVITYMNHFQRMLRAALEDLGVNGT